MVPDGFIACLFGPVPAKTHDAKLLRESELLDQLEEIMPPLGNSTIYTCTETWRMPNLCI